MRRSVATSWWTDRIQSHHRQRVHITEYTIYLKMAESIAELQTSLQDVTESSAGTPLSKSLNESEQSSQSAHASSAAWPPQV